MQTRIYLSPADHGRELSLEEFERADSREGYRYELIFGRLEVSPIPELPHERLCKWLERRLDNYAEARPDIVNFVRGPGRVFVPDIEEGVTAPEPDLVAYTGFPLDLPLDEVEWRDVSPLLVAEVISEDTADKDLQRNRRLYLRVPSIAEYWIIDPRQGADRPSLIAYRRAGRRWARAVRVAAGGSYTTPLLPDFTLVLRPRPA